MSVAVAISGDRQLIEVLNAIEQYVAARNEGPALLGLGERTYRLHAVPAPRIALKAAA